MTAEDIIQRLLDERKISVKEAMILLKAIINVVADDWIGRFKRLVDETNKKAEEERKNNPEPNFVPWTPAPQNPNPWTGPDVVVCYGVQMIDYPLTVNNSIQTCTSEEQDITKTYTAHANSSAASTYVFNQDGSCDSSIKVNDYSTKKKHIH